MPAAVGELPSPRASGWCSPLRFGISAALQAPGSLTPLGIWLAILTGHATRCGLSVFRFRQEKWRDIRVEAGAQPA